MLYPYNCGISLFGEELLQSADSEIKMCVDAQRHPGSVEQLQRTFHM